MGIYNKYVLPRVTNYCCGTRPVQRQRQKVVPLAKGRVLEIGVGSGLNFPFYDSEKIERVVGLEPSEDMLAYARPRAETCRFPVEWLMTEGETIPLGSQTMDTVLVTYTLCTIPDVIKALVAMRAVLKREGRLVFCEHGKAPDITVQRWQRRFNPIWRRLGGGCHLDRDIPGLLDAAGFQVRSLDTMYLPNTPRITGFNYWGWAEVK